MTAPSGIKRCVFRLSHLILVVFALAILPGLANAQLCGMSFVRVTVLDADQKPVEHVSIELLGKISNDEYKELAKKHGRDGAQTFEISANVAFDLIGRLEKLPDADDCGNPLKQDAGVTVVKDYRDNSGSTDNFGFCLMEGNRFGPVLVKLSAPRFETSYHTTNSFYGCNKKTTFQLRRSGN